MLCHFCAILILSSEVRDQCTPFNKPWYHAINYRICCERKVITLKCTINFLLIPGPDSPPGSNLDTRQNPRLLQFLRIDCYRHHSHMSLNFLVLQSGLFTITMRINCFISSHFAVKLYRLRIKDWCFCTYLYTNFRLVQIQLFHDCFLKMIRMKWR